MPGAPCEILETLHFVQLVLQLPAAIQGRLRTWFEEHRKHLEKRE